MVEVQRHGDGDVHGVNEGVDHGRDDLVAALVLGGAHGALHDQRRLGLLGRAQDGHSPLEVVLVEGADAIVTGHGLLEHVGSVDEHVLPPLFEGQQKPLRGKYIAPKRPSCPSKRMTYRETCR